MNRKYMLIISILVSLSGCWCTKRKTKKTKPTKHKIAQQSSPILVDIPLAGDNNAKMFTSKIDEDIADNPNVLSFFDDEMDEFVSSDNVVDMDSSAVEPEQKSVQGNQLKEFSWTQKVDEHSEDNFREVYFDFDRYSVHSDQQARIEKNINQIKTELDKAREIGLEPEIIVEGHACHSAGSETYNLAISEKRAKNVADRIAQEEGISQSAIKVVGRGQEVPVIIDGEKVTGSREDQWPNRRVEVKIIYS